jgi:branched-subunit amino acid ABC-type transport system permease component
MTEVAQFLLNGVMAGSLIMLPAIGFSLIYGVLRFPNFSVASVATVGGFTAYVAINLMGWPMPAAIVFSFLVAGAVGLATDLIFLRPLRKTGIVAAAIGSLALNIFIENVVRFSFGNDLRALDTPIMRDIAWLGVRIGPQQIANVAWALATAAMLFLLLKYSILGKQMRAVADNPGLATIHRINPLMIGGVTTFIAMGMAGIGGALLALDTTVDPMLGFRVLLPLFAATVVGGIGSTIGAVVGSGVIGITEEFAAVAWSPAYRTAVGFIAIVVTLLIRPEGLFGRK